MKYTSATFLTGAVLAAALITGCGRPQGGNESGAKSSSSTPTTEAAAAKPATGRAVQITANDQMKFNITEIRATPGEALAVTLTNEGSIPKFSMGHNWVLFTPDIDLTAFVQESAMAAATDYVPASFLPKVIVHTKLLGPKESDTVLFYAPKTPGRYPFICSFPGHMQVGMKGELIVE